MVVADLAPDQPKLDDQVPIPPKDLMNTGLSSATEAAMLTKFGNPGPLGKDCADPTDPFRKQIKWGVNVGPFKVSGLAYAVESLAQIFAAVEKDLPDVYAQVKNDGVLCVRARRSNPSKYSNHSWGTAIDLYFGAGVVKQGVALTHRGNLLLYPYFNKFGWYWGAEFSGDSVDTMHFELALETILKLP